MPRFPSLGELFENRYRIVETIGAGGFAKVYRARQVDLERDVALKILTPAEDQTGRLYERSLVERFDQEAKLVSKFRDPHTITMFDYGRTSDGLLYMVFEFIGGSSLKEIVAEEGALAPARVMRILEQAARSLQEAHAYGVMHRDIKPGNIMLYEHIGRRDQVKVLDFGIAKVAKSSHSGNAKDITADGTLVGTPRYMSPEQIRGGEVTAQSDIYSLGLVAYELLAGEKAIASNSSITIIGMQLDPRPFQLPEDLPVPPGARYIVDKMLAKDQDVRYSNTEELLVDLGCWKDMVAENEATSRLGSIPDLPMSHYDPAGPSPFSPASEVPAQPARSQNTVQQRTAGITDDSGPTSQLGHGSGPSSQLNAGPSSHAVRQPGSPLGPGAQPVTPSGPNSQVGANTASRTHPDTHGSPSQIGYGTGPIPQQDSPSGQFRAPDPSSQSLDSPAQSNKIIVVIALLSVAVAGIGLYAVTASKSKSSSVEHAPAAAQTAVDTVSISTVPSGLAVEVNGRNVGFSPVDLEVEQVAFPALVAARLDDDTEKKVEIATPRGEVEISFAEEIAVRELEQIRSENSKRDDDEADSVAADIAAAKEKTSGATLAATEAAADSEEPVDRPASKKTRKSAVATKSTREREPRKTKPRPAPEEPKESSKPVTTPTFMPMDKHE